TQVCELPDAYRGRLRHGEPQLGPRYAADVAAKLAAVSAAGRRVSAFVAEAMPGVAGQVELPPGYLAAAYAAVRAAGGVCVADEIQVGFGRFGSHFWGFQAHGVVPDIVTAGKPIGNGHPLGAVITTPEIARSFETGMEYFNTFGGNPVSCAAGLAVLDVLTDERLQARTAVLGGRLLGGLRELAQRHPLIGDVRGRGLFLGVELVADRITREPAPDLATRVVESALAGGVLLSTDGPYHNVLKLKPPLALTETDVDLFLAVLDRALDS
ncbi:MAG TPA: aminotransferase class III-fold pyridoxal phosphate-dependent enzyme, partial [Micromonosporaceae bacterium]|nr:aminotransferase class III-fold pyridoxal phosphate-dependent enzyme [Micromonosporaceae bacterium]